ncbi:OmpA family protein [Chitiniphilus eburneus]|uniref:OmpA family protein n=1 Tax=Chitiniphilus eburneus TaxID=2571148 RepID=A0A4U0Q1P7_9NEIS|nr:OmpA family protein [Chitiniphilus eburneus]TJZ74845.1 OmpA family protein [Chitiniphilus eburneus]
MSIARAMSQPTRIATLIGLLFSTAPAWALEINPTPACGVDERPCIRGNTLQDASVVGRNGDNPPNSERDEPVPGMAASTVRRMLAQPAPASAPVLEREVREETRSDTSRSRFDSGMAELLDDDRAQLDALIADVRAQHNLRFLVIGHTDSQRLSPRARARYRDNQGLSEARALMVADYLQRQLDLPVERFSVEGRAEREPVASNATPEGMARNRRVEIRVWYDVQPVVPSQPAPAAAADACPAVGDSAAPFRVTIDGMPQQAGEPVNEADARRCTDVALASADLQVKYDDLAATPSLNGWTDRQRIPAGEMVRFHSYSNYVRYLDRAEIRVYPRQRGTQGQPLWTLPIPVGGDIEWTPPADAPAELLYVLRVYDTRGRYDETVAKPLLLAGLPMAPAADADDPAREALTGWGENARQLAGIPVNGGTISVSGTRLSPGQTVTVLGAPVPVDRNGRFAVRQIVPVGAQTVDLTVRDPDGTGIHYRRNLTIPDRDWFLVAMGDLTVGQQRVSGPSLLAVEDNRRNDDGATYVDGRGAFYLKGRLHDDYLITASLDTGEQPLEDMFSNFASKDPRYLLRRLDPDRYYPTYGDDSTLVDDAPTQGKFYVKVEQGDSSVMWGDFRTAWTGTELTQYSRGLYGANLQWYGDDQSPTGGRTSAVNAFAAQPGTMNSREAFQGTGGSLYYLRHFDITNGSERVWLEVRDRDSGMVLDRKQLIAGQDYDVNYLQGRLTLARPLASHTDAGSLVRAGSQAGNPAWLIVNYEYTPGLDALDGDTYGLRASQWLGEHIRLGVTGYRQGDPGAEQRLKGADLLLRHSDGTYLQGELAESNGSGSGTLTSIDGGFSFGTLRGDGRKAQAQRLEGALDLADVIDGGEGRLSAYYQHRDQGYSGPGLDTLDGQAVTEQGLSASVPLGSATTVEVKADQRNADTQDYRAAEVDVHQQLNAEWRVSAGARHDRRDVTTANASATLSAPGQRTDAIVRADYTPTDEGPDGETVPADWSVYGYGQGTLERDDGREANNRIGVGGSYQLTERLRADGEVSEGNGGAGGKLGLDYRIADRSNAYLQFVQDTERPDLGYRGRSNSLVTGGRYQASEQINVYAENRASRNSGQDSVTQAFGIDLAPNDRWTIGGQLEVGTVSDELAGDLERHAISGTVAYKKDREKFASTLEYRTERGDQAGKRETWLTQNSYGNQLTAAWRVMGKVNASYSQASQGAYFDGNYVETELAAAYRPVDNDRWNTLLRYQFLYSLPSPGQVTDHGGIADYAQRSHVVSVDTLYDLWPWLTVGGKYAMRLGELKETRVDGEWFSSSANLMVARADWHFVHQWDALLEWRRLAAREADDVRQGALVAVYRHLGNNVKAGVGYNFTDFSDDLTDLSYRSRGWFINVLAVY